MEPPPPFATPQSAGPLGMPVAGTAKRRAVSPTGRVGSYRTRPAANYPRKRAVSACLVCRGRKTKCDNQRPACGFCQQTGAECVYSENERTSTFDPASLAILDRLTIIEGLVRNPPLPARPPAIAAARPPPEPPSPHTSPTTASPSYSASPRAPPLAGGPPLARPPHDVHAYDSAPSEWLTARIPVSAAVGTRIEDVLAWPIFNGAFDAGSLLIPIFADNSCDVEVMLRESMLADTRLVPDLAERFLKYVHTKNPILDATVLDGYVAEVTTRGFGWNSSSCLVLLVCALGAISDSYLPGRDGRYPSLHTGAQYFEAASRRLGLVMSTNSLMAVQCGFLAGVYRMYTMRQFAAWKCFNYASVACLGYLHCRAMIGDVGVTADEKHFEQRVYWSCLKSELELCVELNITPSGLVDLDYPHAFPSPPSHLDFVPAPNGSLSTLSVASMSTMTFPPPPRDQDELTWFYYLGEIALRKLEIRIATTLSLPPRSTPTTLTPPELLTLAAEFSMQIELWRSCLPAVLHFPESPELPCSDERLQYLRARYWWNLSRLYRPFIYLLLHHRSAVAAAIDDDDRRRVADYATKALAIDAFFARSFVKEHRHHGAWLGLRAGAMTALVLLAARRGACDMPRGWAQGVAVVKDALRMWEREAGDAKAMRMAIETVESWNAAQ